MLLKSDVHGTRGDVWKEKLTSISRSILACKKRPAHISKKRKQIAHQQERSRVKRELQNSFDEDSEALFIESKKYKSNIKAIVNDRRDGDNSGAIISWAENHKEALKLPLESRISYMKRRLGKGLGGRHAITHLKLLKDYKIPEPKSRWEIEMFDLDTKELLANPPFKELALFYYNAFKLPDIAYVAWKEWKWTRLSLYKSLQEQFADEAKRISEHNTLGYISYQYKMAPPNYGSALPYKKFPNAPKAFNFDYVPKGLYVRTRIKEIGLNKSPAPISHFNPGATVDEIEAWLRDMYRRSKLPRTLNKVIRGYEHKEVAGSPTEEIIFTSKKMLNPEHSPMFKTLIYKMRDMLEHINVGSPIPEDYKF